VIEGMLKVNKKEVARERTPSLTTATIKLEPVVGGTVQVRAVWLFVCTVQSAVPMRTDSKPEAEGPKFVPRTRKNYI